MHSHAFSIHVSDHVKINAVEDGAIIFDAREGHYAQVNLTAFRVLDGIGKGLSTTDIIDGIASEFDVERAIVEQDVATCLSNFFERGWIERGER